MSAYEGPILVGLEHEFFDMGDNGQGGKFGRMSRRFNSRVR